MNTFTYLYINVIVVISPFLIQSANVEDMSKDLILRNRCDGSVTSNGGTAEMASKISASRQKLHSSLLPSVIFYGHFNFAGIPRSGRYDRLARHRKIAACDSQIFPFVPMHVRHFTTALFKPYQSKIRRTFGNENEEKNSLLRRVKD